MCVDSYCMSIAVCVLVSLLHSELPKSEYKPLGDECVMSTMAHEHRNPSSGRVSVSRAACYAFRHEFIVAKIFLSSGAVSVLSDKQLRQSVFQVPGTSLSNCPLKASCLNSDGGTRACDNQARDGGAHQRNKCCESPELPIAIG